MCQHDLPCTWINLLKIHFVNQMINRSMPTDRTKKACQHNIQMLCAKETMELRTPHIPLGIPLEAGIEILRAISSEIEKHSDEKEDFYKVCASDWECGFYAKDGVVHSSWYNDPSGRETKDGINLKVTLYLARYGNIDGWIDGINNVWIQFFTNEKVGVGMAYGLHNDVLRFNRIG